MSEQRAFGAQRVWIPGWQEITSGLSGGADLNGDGTTDIYDLQLLYEMASTQKLIVVNY